MTEDVTPSHESVQSGIFELGRRVIELRGAMADKSSGVVEVPFGDRSGVGVLGRIGTVPYPKIIRDFELARASGAKLQPLSIRDFSDKDLDDLKKVEMWYAGYNVLIDIIKNSGDWSNPHEMWLFMQTPEGKLFKEFILSMMQDQHSEQVNHIKGLLDGSVSSQLVRSLALAHNPDFVKDYILSAAGLKRLDEAHVKATYEYGPFSRKAAMDAAGAHASAARARGGMNTLISGYGPMVAGHLTRDKAFDTLGQPRLPGSLSEYKGGLQYQLPTGAPIGSGITDAAPIHEYGPAELVTLAGPATYLRGAVTGTETTAAYFKAYDDWLRKGAAPSDRPTYTAPGSGAAASS
jgi:hypothetical protein